MTKNVKTVLPLVLEVMAFEMDTRLVVSLLLSFVVGVVPCYC